MCFAHPLFYYSVILSNTKDLITSTLCTQILRFAQNDTKKIYNYTKKNYLCN